MLYFLLGLNGILLVLPKLILIKFTNDALWGDVTLENLGGAIAQDVVLAIIAIMFAVSIIRKGGWKRVAVSAAFTGCLLLLLMFDMRARELWIKPIDFNLLRYTFENAGGLTSGTDLFFNHSAGLGMTFRRLLFFVCIAHIANWCLISWVFIRNDAGSDGRLAVRPFIISLAPLACLSLVIAVMSAGYRYRVNENVSVGPLIAARQHTKEGYRYRMNENFIVSALIEPIRSVFSSPSDLPQLAARFEQKPQPLSGQPEKTILRDIRPFKNVVVIVYESVRWRGLNIDDIATTSPILARMALQGILSKSYVSVPHSAKSYFAILSGRYPYPGVEAREALNARQDFIWHEFTRQEKGSTFAFSSLFFGFENMGGQLKALGINERFQTEDMAKDAGKSVAGTTSFGSSDELLYELGVGRLSKIKTPFAAVFFPMAAHYPYECPGAIAGRHNYEDYLACIRYSDKLLAKLIDEFRLHHLLEDTLFVIVGDHGEVLWRTRTIRAQFINVRRGNYRSACILVG